MPEYSIVESAVQLGGVVRSCVDLMTGEVLDIPGERLERAGARREAGGTREAGNSGVVEVPGLSKAHISRTEPKQASIMGWAAGSLLKVQRSGPYSDQVGGGKRGKVKEFSKGARRRFMYLMGTVQRVAMPTFVTLTYPDKFPEDLATWAKHLERLRDRLKRRGWGCIWRREFQVRKSGANVGKLAPHYHLLVWGASMAELRAYIPRAWWECCGKISEDHLRAGTRIEVLRTWRGVMAYVSKYMAKLEDLPALQDGQSVGRFWGVINRGAVPWAECIEMTVSDKTVNTFFRYMRRYAHMKARCTPSMTILCADPWQWLRSASQT